MVRALRPRRIARNIPDGDRDPFDAACRPELAALVRSNMFASTIVASLFLVKL